MSGGGGGGGCGVNMRNWTARRVGNSYGRSGGGVVVSATICGVARGGFGVGGGSGVSGGYRRRRHTADAHKTLALYREKRRRRRTDGRTT